MARGLYRVYLYLVCTSLLIFAAAALGHLNFARVVAQESLLEELVLPHHHRSSVRTRLLDVKVAGLQSWRVA